VFKFLIRGRGHSLHKIFGASAQVVILLSSLIALASPSQIDEASAIYAKGDVAKAIRRLVDTPDTKLSQAEQAQKYFALGAWSLEKNSNAEARNYLLKSIDLKVAQKAHAHYLIAHSYKKDKDFISAVLHYTKSFEENPPLNIFFQARMDYADMAIEMKQYKKALDNLTYVERRQRGDYRYPEIVWKLIGVELKMNRRVQACRWARKMYSSFPGHSLAKDWGVDLHLNKYEGTAIGCVTTAKEMRTRNKRLFMSGDENKAKAEIDELISRYKPENQYEIDIMRAEFLQLQGYSDEALKLLVKYYDQQKSNFNFLSLFARVAARANEYQVAVGAYMRSYQISPKSRAGRQALFSAAFLSYQFQDYDGATRRFQEFISKYGRSGLGRDAEWHLAWVKYLKGDYYGAEKGMIPLAVKYKGRGRKRRVIRDDRVRYWLAMTELKREKWGEARDLFSQLARSSQESYYALLAQYRLSTLPNVPLRRDISSAAKTVAATDPLANLTNLPLPVTAASPLPVVTAPPENEEESEEAEETMSTADSESAAEESAEETQEETAVTEPGGLDTKSMPVFKQAKLNERFARANALIQLGFYDWARWELYEIERRTSSKAHLRPLMEAYNKIGSYNRSAYISEIYFSTERAQNKPKDGGVFWETSYPKAFFSSVDKYSKKFGVEFELVLAIMRAESHYNKDVSSPVGARGLMQVMPYTGEKVSQLLGETDYKDEMLFDPDTNIRWGTSYLARLQKKFKGQLPLVAAGYNAGPHRVNSWLSSFGNRDMDEFIEHVPFVETRNYMKKVAKNYAVYKSLYSDSKNALAFLTKQIPVRVEGRPATRENWEPLD
jgi:soluble lytic murein transglycosylase